MHAALQFHIPIRRIHFVIIFGCAMRVRLFRTKPLYYYYYSFALISNRFRLHISFCHCSLQHFNATQRMKRRRKKTNIFSFSFFFLVRRSFEVHYHNDEWRVTLSQSLLSLWHILIFVGFRFLFILSFRFLVCSGPSAMTAVTISVWTFE